MTVFVANPAARVDGFGFGFDGHAFCYARRDDSRPSFQGWDADGDSALFSQPGWISLSECAEDSVPESLRESLRASFAEAQAAEAEHEAELDRRPNFWDRAAAVANTRHIGICQNGA